jgi:polysaccharide biosynthesis transport protein
VVRAEYVPRGAVLRTLELLELGHTVPSGRVLNGFVERRGLIGCNYSYGMYHSNRCGKDYRYSYGHYGASYDSGEK